MWGKKIAISLFLFSFFSLPFIFAETSTVTLSVGTYTAITLSDDYISDVGFGTVYVDTTNSASKNGNGYSSHSGYYVSYIGNVKGNVTFSCSDFGSGIYTISKDNFNMTYTLSPSYASNSSVTGSPFTNPTELGNLDNGDKIYSNYFLYIPYNQHAGTYSANLTIGVEAS